MGLFENSHFPYTNFHELNLDKVVEISQSAKDTAETAAATVGQYDNRLTAAERDIDTAEGNITALQGSMSTVQSDISSIESDITSMAHDIEQNADDIDSVERTVGEQGVDISRLQNVVGSDHELLSDLNSDFMRDHETLTTTAATVGTLEQTVYPMPDQISALQSDMGTAETNIAGINTQLSLMDTRLSGDESDIAALDGRLAGAEDEIDTKSTVAIEQFLGAGVKIATIDIDGSETNLYAPTAGSTVVRAQDVPFDNTGVTPAMTATECQEAIEELNTNTGSVASDLATETAARITADQGLSASLSTEIIARNAAIADVYAFYDPLIFNEGMGTIYTGTSVFAGYVYNNSGAFSFMVPYNKGFDGSSINPKDNPSSYQFTIQGKLFARGVNGYILNNVDVAASDISSITMTAGPTGIKVDVVLATAANVPNATPVTVSMGNSPYVRWTRVNP